MAEELNDTIGELRAELSETRVALEAERLDRYGAAKDRDLLLWLHAEAVWRNEQAVMEEALRWRKIVEQWEHGHQAEVLPYTSKLEAEVAGLKAAIADIDAHATPVGLLHNDDPEGSPHHYLLTVGALHRALGKAYTAEPCESERARLRVEVDRLRREAQFELHGINVDMEDFFIHVNDRVEFVRPDGRRASGVVVDVDPARVLADDTGNVTSNPIGLSKKRPCACLPEGAVLPAGWSLPQCAVHQDGASSVSVLPEETPQGGER